MSAENIGADGGNGPPTPGVDPAPRYAMMPDPLTLPFRIGHGYDIHRLRPGGKLMMAGVEVADGISPVAHSDGDVVLHAVVDALLGALGLGDIGETFPNSNPLWKDASSRLFVEYVMAHHVTPKGYELVNLDVTVQAERPKLNAFKRQMVETLAALLEALPEQVNVKAGTNEGCDAIGRGEAVAAHAVVLLAAGG